MTAEITEEQKKIYQERAEELNKLFTDIKSAENLKGPKRLENESFDDYKDRRSIENFWTKLHLKGKYAWLTTNLIFDKDLQRYFNKGGGTYRKAIFGELK